MKCRVRTAPKYRAQKQAILEQVQAFVDKSRHPVSVRQVHYHLVNLKVIANTAANYRLVSGLCVDSRCKGELDGDKIIDDTRGTFGARCARAAAAPPPARR